MLSLTRVDLLEACNEISNRYGGRHLGTVEGYRNQWLIAVELHDTRQLDAAGALFGIDFGFEEGMTWIRCGFCQTNISRAPSGGFSLEIPYEALKRCRTVSHVVAYFETWLGVAAERAEKRQVWEEMADAVAIDEPGVRMSFRLVRQAQQQAEVVNA